jgi:glutamate-1-semialdehyde 2,1-aminomutase
VNSPANQTSSNTTLTLPLIDSWPLSEAAWKRTQQTLSGGVSTGLRASMKPHPLFIEKGEGAYLTDLDGNQYTDYVLGWGPVILGHGHPGLSEAVESRLRQGATYGTGHLLEAEAAEAVVSLVPGADRVLWTNTGSEANQVALRLVRAFTKRRRFVKFRGHYHGWTDTFLVGYRPAKDGTLGLGSDGQDPKALDDVDMLDWGDLDSLEKVLNDPAKDIAAVFLEPVLVNSGVISAPEGFLQAVRQLCDRAGVVLVFDEVITGFRVARGGAAERYGVTPDLVILAKAIAGGYSLAAIAGKAAILDQVTQGVVHAGTYNGNPIVLAAAVATLKALGEEGVYDDFERRGRMLATGLQEAFEDAGHVVTVNQVGPIVQVIPNVADAHDFDSFLRADQGLYDRFIVEMLRRGQFILPGGRWYISTAHTDDDIATTVAAAREAIAAVNASMALDKT